MTPRARTLLILSVAAQAAVSIVQFGLPAIGLEVRDELGVGPAGFGVVFAAVGLGSAAVLLPTGMLVDRFGARPVLLAGAALNATGYIIASSSTDATVFACALFVAGIGSASVPVAGMSALLREFPPEKRGIALGWRQLAVPLGGTIGAAMLPLLAHLGGVRLAMLVAAALTATTAALFALRSPGGAGESSSLRLDGVLSAPGMRSVMALGLLYAFALSATLTYIVPAARELDISAAQAGVLFAVVNVSAAAARLVWGRLADGHGGTRRARTLAETGALAAGAALLMPLALRAGVVPAVIVTCALSFGAFGFNGVLYVTAGEIAGAERAGRAVGVASTVVFACTSALTPVAGLVAETLGYDAMWLLGAASSATGAAIAATALTRAVGARRSVLVEAAA